MKKVTIRETAFGRTAIEFEYSGAPFSVCLEELPKLLESRNDLIKDRKELRRQLTAAEVRAADVRAERDAARRELEQTRAEPLYVSATDVHRAVCRGEKVFDSILGRARAQVREGNLDLAISELIAAIEALRA
jgi:uncharacterized protein (DUF3084 family)